MPATDPFSRFSLASEGFVTSVVVSPSCEFAGSAAFVELVILLGPLDEPGEICFLFISGFCVERMPPSSRFLMDDTASRRRHKSRAAPTSFFLIKSGLIDLTSRRYLRFTGGMLHGSINDVGRSGRRSRQFFPVFPEPRHLLRRGAQPH
jgi:hypothetical protein